MKKYGSRVKACFCVLAFLFFPVSIFMKHRNGKLQRSPRCTVFCAVKRTIKATHILVLFEKNWPIVTCSRTLFSSKRSQLFTNPQIFLDVASAATSFLRYRKQSNQSVNSRLTFKWHDAMEPEEPKQFHDHVYLWYSLSVATNLASYSSYDVMRTVLNVAGELLLFQLFPLLSNLMV